MSLFKVFSLSMSLCLLTQLIHAESSYEVLAARMWEGREAGAKRDFVSAKKIFSQIQKSAQEEGLQSVLDWGLDEEITVLEKLISLKSVKDPQKYKVLVIFLKETDAVLLDTDGKLKPGTSTITPDQIRKTRIFFEYQKHFVEAFSRGNLVVETSYVETPFKVTRMDDLEHKQVNVADILSLEPGVDYRRFLYEKYNDYDVFCYIWPKPFGRTQGEGGIGMQYSLLPYLYQNPQRGYTVIPANWTASPETRNTFIHEIFHTLEYNVGMFPSHGWMDYRKDQIPGFSGESEYEYYQWRFDTSLSHYQWKDINYRYRYHLGLQKDIFENYLSLYKKYSYAQNEKAYSDYKANRIDQGLKSYPEHPYLLYEKGGELIKQKKYPEAEKIASSLYRLDPLSPDYILLRIKTAYWLENYDELNSLVNEGVSYQVFGFWDKISVAYYLKDSANYVKGLEEQENLYNLLVDLNPANNEYTRARGYFYLYDKKDLALAEQDFKAGLEYFPEDPLCYIALGEVQLHRKKYEDAEKLFSQALLNTPSFGKKVALAYLYPTYYTPMDNDTKKMLIEKAMQYAPTYHQAYRDYAWLLRSLNRKEEALAYFKKSAVLGNEKSVATIKELYGQDYRPLPVVPEKKSNQAIRVGVYEIYDGLMEEFAEHLEGVDDIVLSKISASDILKGRLSGIDVLINPGGNPDDYSKGLDEKGHQAIRDFIQIGGHFIGICAGTYFAIDDKHLDLVDAVPFNTKNWARGTGDVLVQLSTKGQSVFGEIHHPFWMRYANGTMMEPYDKTQGEPYEVLARFVNGLAENGAPDIMAGREAIILSKYGKGKILLFVPHPEYTSGKGYFIRKAVYYLMGR